MELLIIGILSCLNFLIIYHFIAPLYGLKDEWRLPTLYDNDRATLALIFGAGTATVLMMAFPRPELIFLVLGAGLIIDVGLYVLPRIFKLH